MSHSNGLVTKPVDFLGDNGTVLGSGSGDMGTNATFSSINPMAKYKPVRHSSKKELTLEQLASVRFGFGSALSVLPPLTWTSDNPIPSGTWTYEPPRGVSSQRTEYYRDLDFDGYDHNACCPIALLAGSLIYDGFSMIMIFFDSMSTYIRTDHKTWIANRSLSLAELVGVYDASEGEFVIDSSYRLALILYNTTRNTMNIIVTKVFAHDIAGSPYYNQVQIQLCDVDHSDGSHPGVPILSPGVTSSRANDNFTIIACLVSGYNLESGTDYTVITENFPTPYSLAFVAGCDRVTAKLESGEFKMDGTQIKSVSIQYDYADYDLEWGGLIWKAYTISVYANLSTVNVAYSGRTMNISGTMQLDTGNYGFIGPEPGNWSDVITQGIAATNLNGGQDNQSRLIYSTGQGQYLWIMYNPNANPPTIFPTTVTVDITFDYPFNTPLVLSPSKTQVIPS